MISILRRGLLVLLAAFPLLALAAPGQTHVTWCKAPPMPC